MKEKSTKRLINCPDKTTNLFVGMRLITKGHRLFAIFFRDVIKYSNS